jgi:hypothetical protein
MRSRPVRPFLNSEGQFLCQFYSLFSRVSAEMNLLGVRKIIKLCHQMTNLDVSTTFAVSIFCHFSRISNFCRWLFASFVMLMNKFWKVYTTIQCNIASNCRLLSSSWTLYNCLYWMQIWNDSSSGQLQSIMNSWFWKWCVIFSKIQNFFCHFQYLFSVGRHQPVSGGCWFKSCQNPNCFQVSLSKTLTL